MITERGMVKREVRRVEMMRREGKERKRGKGGDEVGGEQKE